MRSPPSGCGVTGWPNWGSPSLPPPSAGPGCTSPACAGAGSSRTRMPAARGAALASNRAAIEEAAALEADALILVSGGLVTGSRDLGLARRMITDAIAELVPRAQELGVRLGIEPLHPMFCADRCVLVRLGDAVDLALQFPADAVGVVVEHLQRLVGFRRRRRHRPGERPHRELPAGRLGQPAPRGRPAGPGPSRRRLDRLRADHRPGPGRPATPATPRWRSSTRKSGTPRPTKPPPPSRPASPPCSADRRVRVHAELLRGRLRLGDAPTEIKKDPVLDARGLLSLPLQAAKSIAWPSHRRRR